MADPFVVSTSSGTIDEGASTFSLSIPTALENDIVRIRIWWISSPTITAVPSGWTDLVWDTSTDNRAYIYKRMGSTPDTTVDIPEANAGLGDGGNYSIAVIRDVDTTTAVDAAVVQSSNTAASWDPAAITTVTDGALVDVCGFEEHSGVSYVFTSAPSGYSDAEHSFATYFSAFVYAPIQAFKTVATAGTENPGAFNTSTGSGGGASGFTIAWRPAAGGGSGTDVNLDAGSFTLSGNDIEVVPEVETTLPLAKWSGDSVSILPSTSWAAPANLFPTEDRNDDSAYSFAAATSTLTLPSSDLADGYLVIGAFEFEDTSNGRHNPQSRFIQASGTGNFVSGSSSGYNRDSSEDRSYVRTWAFIDNPSASSTLQFQWRRDTDVPTGGTVRSEFQVIPLYYSNHGIYSSTSTACPGGTTPTQITGFTAVDESDTAAIEIASNVITLKGDNKRYLVLGSSYWQGIGNARTQRWHGFRVDGTMDDTAKGYSYARNGSNADIGEMFTTIIERETTDITVDQFIYRGPAVGSFPNAGADVAGNTTGSNPNHVTVILELNDGAEVFRSHSTTQQDIDVAGTRVDLQIADSVDFNDSASFAKTSATEIDSVQATDVLLGANVSGGYASTSTARYTGYAEFTVNGTGQGDTFAGDYGRGNQGTQDCWGWSANLMSFVATSASDELGVNAGKITGGEGGTVDALSGWVGFWGLNIQTLNNTDGGASTTEVDLNAGSYTQTGNPLGVTVDKNINLDAGSFAFAGQDLTISVTETTNVDLAAGVYTLAGQSLTIDVINVTSIDLDAGSYSFTGNALTIDVDAVTNVDLDLGTYSLTGHALNITQGANIDLDAGSYTFSGQSLEIVRTTAVSLETGAYTLAGFDLGISTTKQIYLDTGSYAFTGNDLDLGFSYQVNLETGTYNLVGQAIAVDLDNSTTIPLDVGSYTFNGNDLDISVSSNVNLDAGSYTLSGHDLDIDLDAVTGIDLDTGVYVLSGHGLDIQVDNQEVTQPTAGGGHGRSRRYRQAYSEIPLWDSEWKNRKPVKRLVKAVKSKKKRTKKEHYKLLMQAIEPIAQEYKNTTIDDLAAQMRAAADQLNHGATIAAVQAEIAIYLERVRQFELRKKRNNDLAIALLLAA